MSFGSFLLIYTIIRTLLGLAAMMKGIKAIYTLSLLFATICSLFALTKAAYAGEEILTYEHFRYTVNNNEITIVDYGYDLWENGEENTLETIVIPSHINNMKVTKVSDHIFAPICANGGYRVKNLICSDYMHNVSMSDYEAFTAQTLDSITLGKYTKTFDNYNMDSEGNTIKLVKISVPSNAKYLKVARNGALYSNDGSILYAVPNEKKGKFVVSSKTKTIYKHAFYESALDTVKLPKGINKLYRSSFKWYGVMGKGVLKVPQKKYKWYRRYFSKNKKATKNISVRTY